MIDEGLIKSAFIADIYMRCQLLKSLPIRGRRSPVRQRTKKSHYDSRFSPRDEEETGNIR